MNIKQLLHYDLGRLIGRPRREPRRWRMPSFRRGHRGGRSTEIPPQSLEGYHAAAEYPERAMKWRGPIYLRSVAWRHDLLAVMDQIRAIVRTNGPLPDGLLHAARGERRYTRGFRFSLLPLYFAFAAIVIVLLAAAGGFGTPGSIFICLLLPSFLLWRWYDTGLGRTRRERIFLILGHRQRQGVPLSDAMAGMPRFFPAFFVSMIRAGETTGNLDEGLDELGDDTVRAMTLARDVGHNIAYVATVAVIQLVLIAFLTMKVLPVFVDLLAELGGEVPLATRILLRINEAITRRMMYHGWETVALILAVSFLIVAGIFFLFRRRRRSILGRWMATGCLLVPGLRGLLIKHNLALAAMMLDKLLRAGVPLPQALDAASQADLHPWYAARVRHMRDRVNQGESLAEACDEGGVRAFLPRSFRGFVGLGEQSGLLPDAFRRVSEFYRRDVDLRVRVLSDALLPFCVLALGGVTLFYEAAIMGCLLQMVTTFMDSI